MWTPDMPQMGDKVREIVGKVEGIVIGLTEYIWGCEQLLVREIDKKGAPIPDKDGNPRSNWWDVGRFELVERSVISAIQYGESATQPRHRGADRQAPIPG